MSDMIRGRYLPRWAALILLIGLTGCSGLIKDPTLEHAQQMEARMNIAKQLQADGERMQAYQQYLDILQSDATHQQARHAAGQLLQAQIKDVRDALKHQEIDQAKQHLGVYQQMAAMWPDYSSQAQRLIAEIQETHLAKQKQMRIDELKAHALSAEQAGDLPHAAHLYRQILNAHPADIDALTGQKRLLERQENLVRQSLDARRFTEAENRLATLRELSIGVDYSETIGQLERRLTNLRIQRARAREQAQSVAVAPTPPPSPAAPAISETEQAIALQLQRARELEGQGERMQAYAEYLDVLALEAGHTQARDAAKRLLDGKIWLVRSALAQEDITQAETHLSLYQQMSASLPNYASSAQTLAAEIAAARAAKTVAEQESTPPTFMPEADPVEIEPKPAVPTPAAPADVVQQDEPERELVIDLQTAQALTEQAIEEPEPVAPAQPVGERYLDHGNGSVTDVETGLHWMRCAIGQTWNGTTCEGGAERMTFPQTAEAIARFNQAGGIAGYTNWRLPTRDELRTLVYCSSGEPDTWNNTGEACTGDYQRPTIQTEVFPNTPAWNFWTSTPHPERGVQVWEVNFYLGRDGWDRQDSGDTRVRLVR